MLTYFSLDKLHHTQVNRTEAKMMMKKNWRMKLHNRVTLSSCAIYMWCNRHGCVIVNKTGHFHSDIFHHQSQPFSTCVLGATRTMMLQNAIFCHRCSNYRQFLFHYTRIQWGMNSHMVTYLLPTNNTWDVHCNVKTCFKPMFLTSVLSLCIRHPTMILIKQYWGKTVFMNRKMKSKLHTPTPSRSIM